MLINGTLSGPDGTVIATRVLCILMSTSSPLPALSGVAIPEGVTEVTIRAHCSQAANGQTFTLKLP